MIVLFLLLPDLLVEQLSAEDIEARDQASEALRRIGEAALPGLRAERTVSDEVRSRIAWIVASIERETRRARFQGGNVVQGLRGAARVDKKEFALGEQGIVRFEIMNVSGGRRSLHLQPRARRGGSALGKKIEFGGRELG